MISVNEAFSKIIETRIKLDTEFINIEKCTNRVLAEDIISARDQPPFHRVAMDGIAINIENTISNTYSIEGIQAAGQEQLELKNNTNCIEVMTGAVLPEGCNCVIPYEIVDIKNNIASIDNRNLRGFQNIHQQGVDYKAGDLILRKDVKITSAIQAILASQGKSKVKVYKNPKIHIISTGSELIDMDQPVEKHQIYMSNTYALEAELHAHGFTDTIKRHIVDDQCKTVERILESLEEVDILILTGGVSKGKFDFIPSALKEIGAKEVFHRIKQKPGKPLWYGTYKNKQIFALPGNPVSCLITLRRYVIESLRLSQNLNSTNQIIQLDEEVIFIMPLTLFQPVIAHLSDTGRYISKPIKSNGSGDFYSIGLSSGFIELDEAITKFEIGTCYRYYPWGE